MPWARDDHLDAGRPRRFARGGLTLEFGFLVDITGLERSIFIGRWMFDIAVNTNGAAMDHALHAAHCRGEHDVPDRIGIDGAVLLVAQAGLPECRDMVDGLDTGAGALQRRLLVAKFAARKMDPADATLREDGAGGTLAPTPTLVAARGQVSSRGPPVTGGAVNRRNDRHHGQGDPNNRSSDQRHPLSIRRVEDSELMRL